MKEQDLEIARKRHFFSNRSTVEGERRKMAGVYMYRKYIVVQALRNIGYFLYSFHSQLNFIIENITPQL